MRFVLFKETDQLILDREAVETLPLWIQFDGNEDELDNFRSFLADVSPHESFFNLGHPRAESYVNDLISKSREVLCPLWHRKVLGTFRCPTSEYLQDQGRTLYEVLRHDGLLDFITPVASVEGGGFVSP